MLEIKYHWIIFLVIAILLLFKATKKYDSSGGNFTPDTSFLTNIFYAGILLVFILVWGGVFWW